MTLYCETCGDPLKTLFYAHSLFCANDCDRKDNKGWIELSNTGMVFQVLSPGTPFPDDATWYDRWGLGYAPTQEQIQDTVWYLHSNDVYREVLNDHVRREKFILSTWRVVMKVAK